MTLHDILTVHHVKHGGREGYVKVFVSEEAAEAELPIYRKGKIVCAGGYYNGIWLEYLVNE